MTDLRTPPVSDGDLFSERARQYALEKPLQRIHILEAGCGWGTGLELGDRDRQVTGVDLESPELRAHTCERTDLDTWYLGDLRTVPMPPRAYDVVHASYLIERVPHAELVLDRFVAALKPGGLLLVHLRDRNTAFGFLDRHLPRWMHAPGRRRKTRPGRAARAARGAHARVAYAATDSDSGSDSATGSGSAAGPADPATSAAAEPATTAPLAARPEARPEAQPEAQPEARPSAAPSPQSSTGSPPQPAEEQFGRRREPRRGHRAAAKDADPRPGRNRVAHPPRAVYDRVASRQGMQWYCVMRGLVVAEEYTSRQAIDALGAGTGLADVLCRLVSAFSRGRLTADHSEVTMVIRKPENRFARVI
ncbi:class I SAM-dependent methyltransferase [Actinomadura macra]|uniref:class I SAM-dependent methyltransferase n=1 Tax=Actinomadura macra TaxID=46164 RepID=UPI000A664453|nr:methyltransferase domain-containing protein [Actinomadura macra]